MILMAAVLGLLGGYLTWHAMKGQVLPEEAVVDIAPPFPPGHYLIAHGGSTPMINVHLKTLNQAVERFRPWRGQSKALDIFRITPLGFHKNGWQPTDPARYTTFGVPVLSPCSGEVALLVDGIQDMPVPEMDRDHMAGNYVAINCGDFFVILAHLRQGSIAVATGDRVRTGAFLGQMGNSGNTSEPHLHLHAQRGLPAEAPLAGEPLWLTINNRFPVRNDRLHIFQYE
jgi:murein DD-endopeptidase MepM/ murein hydrolase activator NlpD